MTLNTMSRRAWRNELQFPYHNLKDIETALSRQRRRLTHLSRLVDELVQEWRGLYPRDRSQKALMPFYLCRMQQRSNTLLRWRASHANKPLLQRRIHLTTAMLNEFDTATRKLILRFESKKNDLNYQASIVKYDIERLTELIIRIKAARELRKSCYATEETDD